MQAFPVDDKHPDYSTGAPTSAADYLRRVHKEAAESADVTSIAPTEIPGYGSSVANDERPRDYFKADIAPAPEWYTENEEWTMQLTEWFTNLRKQIADGKSKSDVNVDIPHANDEDGWKRLLLAGNSKGVSKAIAMDSVQLATGLTYFAKWLTEAASNDPNGGVADMLLDGHRPHWMFALLLCLEK